MLRLESGEDVGKGGKNSEVQPCGGHPALGEGCLLCRVSGVAQCCLSAFKHNLGPVSWFGLLFHAHKSHFDFFSFYFFLFFSLLFSFSLTESSITESQSLTMTGAEPGMCVKGLREHSQGWPELGACLRWVWGGDGKDGMGFGM